MVHKVAGTVGPRKPRKLVVAKQPETGVREYELHRRGLSWGEVAQQLGHSDARVARAAGQRYLQKAVLEMEAEDRRRAVALEKERLDALQARYWEDAFAGDLDAAKYVLSVIQARIRLQRLDEDQTEDTVRTVVIAGNTKQYVAKLKQLISEQDAVDAELVDDEE